MSARPREVIAKTSTFSLRDVVSAPDGYKDTRSFFTSKEPVAASSVSMKLNFGSNFKLRATPEPPSNKAAHRPNLSFSFGSKPLSPQLQPSQQPHAPTPHVPQIQRHHNEQDKQEVMRLTGFVEDLTTRLKRAVLKYEHTESTLKHTQHALQAEKAASTKQSEAFKKELAISHDKEAKLCAELANRPQRSALSQSAFSQAVGTILADEQRIELHSREVQELEGKIKALGDAKVLIEAEMTGLRKLRDAAASELDSVRAQQSELCAAADESQKLIKVAEEALATIEARKKLAVDELKTTESKNTTIEREYKSVVNKMAETKGQLEALNAQITLIKEQTVEAQTAENVAKKAAAAAESTQANNEALTKKAHTAQAEALNEEIAALTKQKEEMHASIASMHASVASVQAEEMSVQKKLQETNRLVKEAIERHEAVEKQHASMTKVPDFILETDIETPTEMSVLQPCSRGPCITGHINSNIIGVGGTRSMRRAAHAALSRTLPYALIADVSVDLAAFEVDDIAGAIKSHEADDPQTQMVAAVIGDLKAALTTIVEQKVPKTRLVQAI